ncbi:latherin-like [Dasypus novemcinctus]|uniref:latherin-like n=1 Tax=Dasypus novemcinctus TaxID=9361 RepID=UPI0039C966E6
MLKISCLFVLLCGLLGPCSAQANLPAVPTYIADAITQGLMKAGLLSSLEMIDWQAPIKAFLQTSTGFLGALTNPLTNLLSGFGVQMRNPQLLQVSFAFSPDRREVYLQIPLKGSYSISVLGFSPATLLMRADMRIQLRLESVNGRYQLVFGACSLGPEGVRLQPESPIIPFASMVFSSVEKALQNVVPRELAAAVCPMLNNWFRNLDLSMIRELTNLMQPQRDYRFSR